MKNILLLIFGGSLGTLLRYYISTATTRSLPGDFPYGTLSVNLAGCFVIGVLAYLNDQRPFDEPIRLLLFTGILGGFTTFSSFGLESLQLLRSGQLSLAITYVITSNLGGIIFAAGGFWMTKKFT